MKDAEQTRINGLASLTSEMQEARLDSKSGCKAASSINHEELALFLRSARIQVIGVVGDTFFRNLKRQSPGPLTYIW